MVKPLFSLICLYKMYRFEGKKKRARGKTEGRTVARYGSVFQQKKAPGNEHSTGELPP